MKRLRSSLAVVPLVALAVLLGAARSYCPMFALAAGEGEDAHACCKTGLRSTAPSCCHAASAPGSLAVGQSLTAAPPAQAEAAHLAGDATVVAGHPRPSPVFLHGPPLSVLRI